MNNRENAMMPRRHLLGLLGGTGLAAVLGACGVSTKSASSGPKLPSLKVPDAKVTLPSGKVTFRWIDTGARKALFEKPLFAAYEKEHSNIKIQYDGTGYDQVNQVVPLGIRNGSAPDVFAMPSNVPAATAVEQGWVRPIDELIPDFDSWKKAFPSGSFLVNSEIFNGKTYTFPLTGTKQVSQLVVYDVEYLKDADVDPAGLATWDGFRQAAKKITKKGKGKYYGLMGSQSNDALVMGLANSAGWYTVGGMDMKTGEYAYHADEIVNAIELIRAMQSDGSVFPDSASLTPLDAVGRMPSRPAALICDGPFYFPQWDQAAPDWQWVALQMPTPKAGQQYYVPYSATGENQIWVYAKTKYASVAGDLLSYIGSEDGQTQLAVQTQGYLTPILPKAIERAKAAGSLAPHAKMATELSDKLCRLEPDPQVRNADTAQVLTKVASVHPSFDDVMQGLFSGQLKNAKAELQKLDGRLNKNLDTAIAKAKKSGAKVSRNDYVFPNWVPSKDYTHADYSAL
jgi:multiple sugar transport system substrate-binding protein